MHTFPFGGESAHSNRHHLAGHYASKELLVMYAYYRLQIFDPFFKYHVAHVNNIDMIWPNFMPWPELFHKR